MNLEETYIYLRNRLQENCLGDEVARELSKRNLPAFHGLTKYHNGEFESTTLGKGIDLILSEVKAAIDGQEFDDQLSDKLTPEMKPLIIELECAFTTLDGAYDYTILADRFFEVLVHSFMPGIDKYVDSLKDSSLHQKLGLNHDDEYLVDISSNADITLRKHALVVSSHRMIYPHQFLRRFYSSNFVNILEILSRHVQNGLSVYVRIDPLRSWTHPRNYTEIIEADHWHGPRFTTQILNDSTPGEKVTFHYSEPTKYSTYPILSTIFRTSMMDDGLRQFMIEEYSPLEPSDDSSRLSGFGRKYCIQKFGHFVFNQEEQAITHVDGAVRTFQVSEYEDIHALVCSGKDPGSKIGERHKLFLVEGILSLSDAESLMFEWFRYNPHLSEYFGHS